MKKKYSTAEFTSLLQRNGMYENFLERLKYNADMFPAHCRGKVEYLLAYDAYKMRQHFVMDVQIVFDGPHRYSQVKDIRIMGMDDYIELCFSSQEFRDTYYTMLGYVQKGDAKGDKA